MRAISTGQTVGSCGGENCLGHMPAVRGAARVEPSSACRYLALAAFLFGSVVLGAVPDEKSRAPEILQQRCLQCHGPTTQMGDLNLSSRRTALEGGSRGPALAPSDPSGSLLLARILADEMPPGSPLSRTDKDALRKWISDGARWTGPIEERRAGLDWWSLQTLRDPDPPVLESPARNWLSSPVDRWVLAGLKKVDLRPGPQAERADLIRRAYYGLTGLPPEPSEVEEFVGDESPFAYEKLIDRLLASPQYGERWARHWLDLVRFAESEGFERDLPRYHAWPYRDYVIRSFNEDKSYLQFAREQMAGDVMQPATRDGVVATTMLTLGPVDAVGLTSALKEERALIREDLLEEMLGTVAQTFLGLTVNCARCHDHKFDPIPQEEYYRMKAAFQAVWPPTRPVPDRGLDVLFPYGNAILSSSEKRSLDARRDELTKRLERADAELGDLYRKARPPLGLDEAPAPLARWTFDTDGRADFAPLHLQLLGKAETRQGRLRLRDAPEAVAGEEPAEEDGPDAGPGFAVSPTISREIRAKTLEAWVDVQAVPEKAQTVMEIRGLSGYRGASVDGIRFVAGDAPRWENSSVGRFRSRDTGGAADQVEPGARVHIAITYMEDGTITIFRNGDPYGKPYKPDPSVAAGRLQVYPAADAVVRFPASENLHLAEARLYDLALSENEIAVSFRSGIRDFRPADLLAGMTGAERRRVAALETELRDLREALDGMPEPELAHSASIRALEPTYVFIRGAVDQPGKEVGPAGLSCVSGLSAELGVGPGASEGERRRSMAEWIANPANPLFARVIVNRVWQRHFGLGFVGNPSDFGYNGGQPTHPELLDWLASDLVRNGWSLKTLHKRILMSQTYRQSSRFDAASASKDADNRLLWRFSPRRLDAEAVRDSMLAVSGDLNRTMHGPSFQPFEFGEARGSLKRYLLTDEDSPAMRRRTVYRMNVITGGDPMLEALDCPLPSVKAPQRRSTTTALQALSLMNSAFVQQRTQGFAKRVRSEASDPDGEIVRAFQLGFGREPDSREMDASRPLVQRHGLEALCWGILNASEFLYVR